LTIDSVTLDLLNRLLTLDPSKRISCAEALKHPYFTGLPSPTTVIKMHESPEINPTYMSMQTDINSKMRTILVDWMIEVCMKFKLDHQTFFLACTYLDLFLMKQLVTRSNLQLVGCTSILIAAKIVEVWSPEVSDFVEISNSTYTMAQIIAMESIMLTALNYDLYRCTEYMYMIWHTAAEDRPSILKKLYRAVIQLETRAHTWAELMRIEITVDPKWEKVQAKIAAKIDRS
jgi:serine/threonine protein kinase